MYGRVYSGGGFSRAPPGEMGFMINIFQPARI